MRIAFVHDWLTGMRGGEKCLETLVKAYPDCEIFTLFLNRRRLSPTLARATIHCSAIGEFKLVHRFYRYLLPIYPILIWSLGRKLRKQHTKGGFDKVISISHCVAKNISVPNGVPHICYILTPVRYLWDQYERYFSGRWYEPIVRLVAVPFRRWDVASAAKVDKFIAISEFVRSRVRRYYKCDADVVFPPVDLSWIPRRMAHPTPDRFVVVNALVPYKQTEVIVEAFKSLPYQLTVVGSGPEGSRLQRIASQNTVFKKHLSVEELAEEYSSATALVFAAEEDFGITPVEMMGSGGGVIAFSAGGALETIVDGKTGVLFNTCTPEGIASAVRGFLEHRHCFTIEGCRARAEQFSPERFLSMFRVLIGDEVGTSNYQSRVVGGGGI